MLRCSLLFVLCVCLTGCEADDPCDKDQTYKQGSCTPKPAESDDKDKDSGARPEDKDAAMSSDSGGGGGACTEDQAAILGSSCTNDEGCNCAAPYCAKMPGQAMGFCTVYCTTMPDSCPTGYRCFDLSAVGVMGVQPFCLKN